VLKPITRTILALSLLTGTGCAATLDEELIETSLQHDETRAESVLGELVSAIDDDKQCADLFVIFDRFDTNTAQFESAQAKLREINCFTRNSKRSDAAEISPKNDAPLPTSPADREPIGETQYRKPLITKESLFSDQVSDILNAFDTNGRQVKLEICHETSKILSSLSEAELTSLAFTMSDYAWSTLEDLARDCNSIAGNL